MEKLGIRTTTRLAKRYNTWQNAEAVRRRRELFERELDDLLAENGPITGPVHTMEDAWALDTSGTLPHLDRVLADADAIIAERAGQGPRDERYRSFFRNIISVDDLARYPSFLDFACSSEVLSPICRHMGFIPCLSKTLPPGIRFVESRKDLDALNHLPPRDSQLYHIDPYDAPMGYVIVALRDVTLRCGPFTWVGEAASQRAARQLGYWAKGKPYRLSDDEVYSAIDRSRDEHVMAYPRGTVLFLDPSRCMHYGSRDALDPRYLLMIGYVSPARTDFTETFMDAWDYPVTPDASRLRRLVLDKSYRA